MSFPCTEPSIPSPFTDAVVGMPAPISSDTVPFACTVEQIMYSSSDTNSPFMGVWNGDAMVGDAVFRASLSCGTIVVVTDECICYDTSVGGKRKRDRADDEHISAEKKQYLSNNDLQCVADEDDSDTFEPELIPFESATDAEACDAVTDAAQLAQQRRVVADTQQQQGQQRGPEQERGPEEQQWVRRLRFFHQQEAWYGSRRCALHSSAHIQSEMRWMGQRKKLDPSVLSFAYHRAMVKAMRATHEDSGPLRRVACLGLGGGCLPSHLIGSEPSMHIEVIELHPEVVEAASHFGCSESLGLDIIIGDASEVVRQWKAEATSSPPRLDAVLIDIDASEEEAVDTGLSAPAACFLSVSFLTHLAALLGDKGVVVFNVLPHQQEGGDEAVAQAIQQLTTSFLAPGAVLMPAGEGEQNTIVAGRLSRSKVASISEVQLTAERELPHDRAA